MIISQPETASEYLYRHLTPWAHTLLHRCLQLQKGDYLGIIAPFEAMPLVHAVYAQAILHGAHVDTLIQSNESREFFFTYGTEEQLSRTSELWLHLAKNADKYLVISTQSNTRALSEIESVKHAFYGKGYKAILDTVLQRSFEGSLKWCLTQYPTPSLAQEADMSTLAYYKMTVEASFLNASKPIDEWKKQEEWQEKLLTLLSTGKILRFYNEEGTDLEVDVSGMKWINCAAVSNFPDGEVFTGPNLQAPNGGVNGKVHVSFPTVYKNVEVRGIRLEFQHGKVISATSDINHSFLQTMISQDEGASYVGEIAIGTNFSIHKGSKNILFDEKIGGTFHLALGKGYPETGNTNNSQLHWDMVTDLRKSGKIFLDGTCIFEKGTFFL